MRKSITKRFKDRFTITWVLFWESTLSLALAGAFSLLDKIPYKACLMKSVPLICLITMGILGLYAFEALVDNNWRIKSANEEYPVVKSFILIFINAVIFLIMDQRNKSYALFIVPMILWLYSVIVCVYYKRKRLRY